MQSTEVYVRFGQTFSVPTAVADHLLKVASHDQLKILLYVLCHADAPLSAEQIVRACSVLPETVEEALIFWQQVNVLQTAEPVPTVSLMQQTADAPAQQPAAPETVSVPPAAEPVRAAVPMTSDRFSLHPSEIADRVNHDPALAEMFRGIERLRGKIPNPTEQKSLIWIHEYLGLDPDLILMLAAFCVENNCFHARYMDAIAVEWQERGVTTHALVQADIQRRTEAKSYTGKIMKLFEMQRHPTKKQQEYIDKWCGSGIPLELIELAYEKTRENKDDKLSFPYLDGILKRWTDAGIRTAADAEKADAAFHSAKVKPAAKPTQAAACSHPNSSIDMN